MAEFSGTVAQFYQAVSARRIQPVLISSLAPITYTERTALDAAECICLGTGNSLTVGSGSVTPATQNYMAQGLPLIMASQASHPSEVWTLVNRGVGSQTTTQRIAAFATEIQPWFNSERTRNVGALLEVINDIRHDGTSIAQALINLQTWIECFRDNGWEVLLFTVPPTGSLDSLVPGGLAQATLAPINTWIRENAATVSPFPVADIARTGRLDNPEDGAKWNADTVHPNATGYAEMAADFHTALTA